MTHTDRTYDSGEAAPVMTASDCPFESGSFCYRPDRPKTYLNDWATKSPHYVVPASGPTKAQEAFQAKGEPESTLFSKSLGAASTANPDNQEKKDLTARRLFNARRLNWRETWFLKQEDAKRRQSREL